MTPKCAAVVFGLVGLSACIPNRSYRVQNPVLHETPPSYCPAGNAHYTLSFVEFDDMGELWDAGELNEAIHAIQAESANSPLVVMFVHGWKNDASDKSGNVWGFRCELAAIANRYNRTVIGIYLGWRGAVTDVTLFKDFTFWNRITAATRIPGAHMTDVIMRIMQETKGSDGSRDATLIAIGHSFGGLVLERAVTQALVERIVEAEQSGSRGEVRFPADLVVFLNEAGPALQAKQLLDIFYRKHAAFSRDDGRPQPFLLSMTSKGDTATHFAFPGGQALALFRVSLRSYPPQGDEFGIANQKSYFLHTAANTAALQSHVIGLDSDPEVQKAKTEGTVYASVPIDERTFYIVPKSGAKNTTPYWSMQMPIEIVPDHTTIFRQQFEELLIAFLEQRPDMMLRGRARSVARPTPPAPILKLNVTP
jgi:hypothetical protein